MFAILTEEKLQMKNLRWMVGAGFVLCLSACGAAEGTVDEMDPEGEPIEVFSKPSTSPV
jgi:hypothetical protein